MTKDVELMKVSAGSREENRWLNAGIRIPSGRQVCEC
jgi:hypothetical protein